MSNYYKAEEVISFLNMNCPKDMWEYQIADLPTIEVSEDAISREEVYRAIITCGEVDNDLNHLYEVIENFPSVIPQPKEGEWIYCEDDDSHLPEYGWYGIFKCSNCENEQSFPISTGSRRVYGDNYCPNCGARMKGAE